LEYGRTYFAGISLASWPKALSFRLYWQNELLFGYATTSVALGVVLVSLRVAKVDQHQQIANWLKKLGMSGSD
jgi:hypothetical protein